MRKENDPTFVDWHAILENRFRPEARNTPCLAGSEYVAALAATTATVLMAGEPT
jgi:hypothetical protein